jgi:hypothetical protein
LLGHGIVECVAWPVWYLAPATEGEQSNGQDNGSIGMAGGDGTDDWIGAENVARIGEVIGRVRLRSVG